MTQVFREAVSLEQLNTLSRNTAIASLGIVFSAAGDDWLQATMPVDERTRQPYGILHGGASVVLAETLGSSAGNLCVDTAKQICVGLEINANHVRAVRSGTVTGTARALQVNPIAGAFAGLAMGLNGLATAILLPLIFALVF